MPPERFTVSGFPFLAPTGSQNRARGLKLRFRAAEQLFKELHQSSLTRTKKSKE
jgi:hypothetical protein